jgi:hypothetical protein
VGDGGEPFISTYSKRLGEPLFASVTAPDVASALSCDATCAGEADGFDCSKRAAAPAT